MLTDTDATENTCKGERAGSLPSFDIEYNSTSHEKEDRHDGRGLKGPY